MGDSQAERSIDEAGALLRAVAAYRMSVMEVIELKTEDRALTRRLREIPAELSAAEVREAEARMILLQAARGAHGTEAVTQAEREVAAAAARVERASR